MEVLYHMCSVYYPQRSHVEDSLHVVANHTPGVYFVIPDPHTTEVRCRVLCSHQPQHTRGVRWRVLCGH